MAGSNPAREDGVDATTEAHRDETPFGAMPPEVAACPQPFFKELRAATPIISREGAHVLLTRATIDEALRDTARFSSNMSAVDLANDRPLIPLQVDPPDHKKYRKILDPLFAPKQMALLEASVTTLANELIDGFIEDGVVDFAKQFSVPFPSQVFLVLLGLPLDDLPTFLEMKDGIIRPQHVIGSSYGSDEAVAYQRDIAQSIYAYFDKMLDQRQRTGRDDLLTRFLDTEVDGEKLTRNDILDICFLFLIAGLDTVTATLDCMFAYLAQHPEQRVKIVEEPSIIPAVVEELLRWETPVMGVVRVATEDTELAGCPVAKGEQVVALLASANADEDELVDGDVVRFDRDVNRHLAFGGGVHRCLGSHLARQELRIALREWHRRIPDYAIAEGHTLEYTPAIRSIEHFPLTFTAQ
jgi:cytochrome P450